jgi:opine dehydrogenase
MRLSVLGAGNTGLCIAADLALAGHEVLLWDLPAFAAAIEPLRERRQIRLEGAGRTGEARIAAVTTNAREAAAWADVLLCSVPSYAHAAIVDAVLPEMRPGQQLALLPGNLGALAVARRLRERGVRDVVVCESDTAPYVCRKTGPDAGVIWGRVPALGVGVWPAAATDRALAPLAELFPGARPYAHVLAAGLSALNPVVHPPGVLMNAGRIERSRGEFWFYEEGVTPGVVRAIEALDRERLALGRALGLDLAPVAAGFAAAGFGPASADLWAVINGSRMLTALRAPGALDTRWLSEDIPFGLGTWAALAATLGVNTPLMDALCTLAAAALGRDLLADRRGPDALGLAGLDAAGMVAVARGKAAGGQQ